MKHVQRRRERTRHEDQQWEQEWPLPPLPAVTLDIDIEALDVLLEQEEG